MTVSVSPRKAYILLRSEDGFSKVDAMTRKQRRAFFIAVGLAILAFATALVLYAMRDNLSLFVTPSQISERNIAPGQRIRLGGLVEQGSLRHTGTASYAFTVTDLKKQIEVHYTGILPDLFREGQGVVTEGRLTGNNILAADTVFAKHDEKYMPREIADALKQSGEWQGEGAKARHSDTYGQGAYP